jgi:hypothetical protein
MKANSYSELKKRHQKDIDDFPMFFAFSNSQFADGMRKFGLQPDDTEAIYKFGDSGGFYRRTDAKSLWDLFNRHDVEMKAAIDADATGEGFIFDMFDYELCNHEYVYTHDVSDALDALGLKVDDIKASEKLKKGLKLAIAAQPFE